MDLINYLTQNVNTESIHEPISSLTQVTNLCASYAAHPALVDVSFSLEKGQTLGIIGNSGSGKTTISKCLLQLEAFTPGLTIDKGDVRIRVARCTKKKTRCKAHTLKK